MWNVLDFFERLFSGSKGKIIRQNLGSFATFSCAVILVTSIGWSRYYADRIAGLKERVSGNEEAILRYKIALGIEKPDKTALMELTNSALKERGKNIVLRIRESIETSKYNQVEIGKEFNNKKIDEKGKTERLLLEMDRASHRFNEIRVDAFVTIDEMRARIPFETNHRVVTVAPLLRSTDSPKSLIDVWKLVPGPFGFSIAEKVANEIEELSQLLPAKLAPCRPA